MGWSNARAWLTAQSVYDLAQARKKESRIRVAPLEAVGD
jgi:plasmid maintenance system antidote protein VapI